MDEESEFDVFTAIERADSEEDYKIIISYVKEKYNPEQLKDSRRPRNGILHHCIDKEKFQLMVDLLALKKLPLNQADEDGQTPLFYSLCQRKGEFAVELIRAGADVNIADSADRLPLHMAMGLDPKYARMLMENGATATMNCQDKYGSTPLHCSVYKRDIENVCLLLYYGADTDIVCNLGWSPFMESVCKSDHQLQEILIEYEFDFSEERTYHLLLFAIICKSPFVREMIRRGADISNFDVLYSCMAASNLTTFKELWDDKVFERTRSCANILIDLTSFLAKSRRFVPFLEYIIGSEQLQYAIPYLATNSIIKNILRSTEKGYCRRLAEKSVCVLLSCGIRLHHRDLAYIYNEYLTEDNEKDEFFRVLLFMDVCSINVGNLIPSILFSVSEDIGYIIDRYMRTKLDYRKCESEVKWLIRHLRHPKLYRTFLELAAKSPSSKDENLIKKLGNSFPRLLDLSRNQIRQLINSKYKIKNSCQYYTIVESLPLPSSLKEVIEFRKGIY